MRQPDADGKTLLSGIEFRQWAEFGTEAYGHTPWFFLRELAQNARDAGAGTIRVSARLDDNGREVITYADDGCGMDFRHARRYLFRLYSSSKEGERHAAGMYGIGFWTVLHYDPEEICIESRTQRDAWAVALQRDLQVRSEVCRLERTGTRITLIRRSRFENGQVFADKVRSELLHHCRYLRRNKRRPVPLPMFLEGERLNQPMEIPGPLSLAFHRGAIEGVVGVGEAPHVSLYAKGLPIWEGAFLEELLTPEASAPPAESTDGIYPVFLLNSNDLRVNIFRRQTLSDPALQRLVGISRFYLRRLIGGYAQHAFPRRGLAAWRDRISAWRQHLSWFFSSSRRRALSALMPAALFAAWLLLPKAMGIFPGGPLPVSRLLQTQPGLALSAGSLESIDSTAGFLSYLPEQNVLLGIYTTGACDDRRGFCQESGPSSGDEEGGFFVEGAHGFRLSLRVAGGGVVRLPCPGGQRIDPRSITVRQGDNGRQVPGTALASPSHSLRLPTGAATLIVEYESRPVLPAVLSNRQRQHDLMLPDAARLVLAGLLPIRAGAEPTPNEALDIARALVVRLFLYDRSRQTWPRYQSASVAGHWLAEALEIGRGDCGVLNGVAALVLRYFNIPSRLAVGVVGVRGRARAQLHAWVEYHDGGWHSFDVTPFCRQVPHAADDHAAAETATAAPGSAARSRSLPLLFLFGALLLATIPLGRFWRHRPEKFGGAAEEEIRSGLGRIARQMIQNPQAWGWDRRLWNQPFLPLYGGGRLSLRAALLLALRGRLLVARPGNTLAARMPRRSGRILHAGVKAFAPLYAVLPQLIDLDWISTLQAVPPEESGADPLASFLAQLNLILSRLRPAVPPLYWAPGLADRDWHHVHIQGGSFVAVNPAATAARELERLFRKNPRLAVFRAYRLFFALPDAPPPAGLAQLLLRGEPR